MRRVMFAALLLGCQHDLTVNPCSHDPASCAETDIDSALSETSIDIDSSTPETEVDSTLEDTTDSASRETSTDSTVMDSAMPTDSLMADSSVDSVVTDSSPVDTCVCVPGESAAGTGACTNVLEKKTKTCTSSCTWGPETCALPKGWTPIADAPISGRIYASAVWTGLQVIVWGGERISGPEAGIAKGDGAVYTYTTNSWTLLPSAPSGAARENHSAVWTGTEMLIWGGMASGTTRNDGLSYAPSTGSWDTLPTTTLSARYFAATTWIPTVKKMFVWGGFNGTTELADGALYDPGTRTWTALPAAPIAGRWIVKAAWTGSEVLVWGGRGYADGALYDPSTNKWRMVPAAPITAGRANAAYLFDADSFVVFGGYNDAWTSDGAVLSFATLTWSTLPAVPSTWVTRENGRGWLLGGALSIWGGTTGGMTGYPSDGITLKSPSTTWAAVAGTGAPAGRTGYHTIVSSTFAWVWGGQGDPAVKEWPTVGAVFAQ